MQRYLGIEILDLDGCASKFVHELSKGLIVCLLQIGQGGRGHAVRPASGVLHTESFDEGVKAVYRPGWKSTVSGQCCPLRDIGRTWHRIALSLV